MLSWGRLRLSILPSSSRWSWIYQQQGNHGGERRERKERTGRVRTTEWEGRVGGDGIYGTCSRCVARSRAFPHACNRFPTLRSPAPVLLRTSVPIGQSFSYLWSVRCGPRFSRRASKWMKLSPLGVRNYPNRPTVLEKSYKNC
jgi:hypothetical protein